MKKFILAMAVAMIGFCSFAGAPSAETLKASAERIAKLEKLMQKKPKLGTTADLDALQNEVEAAATLAIANSTSIVKMSNDGVNAADLVALTTNVKKEADAVKGAGEKVKPATESLKSLNPMKIGGAKKALSFCQDALGILLEESVAQGLMVAELAK